MIKKIKRKFILISLLSVLFVLLFTIGAINGYNYIKMENDAQGSLTEINNNSNQMMEPLSPNQNNDRMLREHYFIVSFDSDGNVTNSDFTHIFSMRKEEGIELAKKIYASNKKKGSSNYLRYQRKDKDDGASIAFLDSKMQIDNCNSFLLTSSIVSLASYALLAVLVIIASNIAFKTSEESYQKQKAFITNASHELKTPLTIISTDLDIIELDHGKSEWSESIRDQIERLTRMTNQLVTLSKINESDNKYPFELFILSDTAIKVSDTFLATYEQKNLKFNKNIQDGIVLNGNKNLINELFYIFLDNANKYTKDNGTINLSLKQSKNKIELIFSNDIEENNDIDSHLLFERFYRSTDANKKEGAGIGLSIAKQIIDLHKGKVSAVIKDNRILFNITFNA